MPGRINTNNVREMTQGSEMITTSVKNIHFQSMLGPGHGLKKKCGFQP